MSPDLTAIKSEILALLPQPSYDDGSAGPILVRLAWHASGTYDKKTGTGGSNGAGQRFEPEGGDPANAGLQNARDFLLPIKERHPDISFSDLWTYAGAVAIEMMGGPAIAWKGGRVDFVDESKCPPRGRLPDASLGNDHLRQVFYRMGFNDREIVALSGAHALGRCHADRSGYDGPWVATPTRFSNQYFKMLTKFKWEKKEWAGPMQYRNDDLGEGTSNSSLNSSASQYPAILILSIADPFSSTELMMLPTDMALLDDSSFLPWVQAYAEDKDLFYKDFADAFAKLLELGVERSGEIRAKL